MRPLFVASLFSAVLSTYSLPALPDDHKFALTCAYTEYVAPKRKISLLKLLSPVHIDIHQQGPKGIKKGAFEKKMGFINLGWHQDREAQTLKLAKAAITEFNMKSGMFSADVEQNIVDLFAEQETVSYTRTDTNVQWSERIRPYDLEHNISQLDGQDILRIRWRDDNGESKWFKLQGSCGARPIAKQQKATAGDLTSQLIKLAELRDKGILSEAEFQKAKAKLLD